MNIENKNWSVFGTGIQGPKLEWLRHRLDLRGISSDVTDYAALGGPLLKVEKGCIDIVFEILNEEIGELYVTGTKITWADLPDTHQIFTQILSESRNEIAPDNPPVGSDFVLPYNDVSFGGIDDKPLSLVRMYDVDSSNWSAVGFELAPGMEAAMTVYVQFKGGKYYRYFPVASIDAAELLEEAKLVAQNIEGHSVGSLGYAKIIKPAEDGEITCQRWDETDWVPVLPKAQRIKVTRRNDAG